KISLQAHLTRPTSLAQGATPARDLALHRQALELSFPLRLAEGSGSNRVELQGALSLGSAVDFELDFDLSSFTLDELSLTFTAEETFAAELAGQGELTFDESVTV